MLGLSALASVPLADDAVDIVATVSRIHAYTSGSVRVKARTSGATDTEVSSA